jgi:3-hydroxybutyryl-CoA dehydrogenase
MISTYQKVAVIGAGTMGNGIAHVFAMNGYDVNLIDISETALEKAVAKIGKNLDRMVIKEKITAADKTASLARVTTFTSMEAGLKGRKLVVEAATENIDLKKKIFQQMDQFAPADAVLASNTSSISITKLGAATKRSGKVIGMHFFNPVPVMKLVEVINGYDTEKSVSADIMALSQDLGKVPVEANDIPGFVSNRVLMPMINEAIYTLYEGVATAEAIDTVMKLGMAHPMGPLRLADFIGLDVCLAIMEVLYNGFGNPKYAPCPLLRQMVDAGHLGDKSGKGFFEYNN